MKKWVLILIPSAILVFTSSMFKQTGIAGKTGSPGEATCQSCHSDFALNSGPGTISISNFGMNNWQYVPGQTYPITVTVSQLGAPKFGFGLECLTSSNQNAGSLTIIDPTATKLLGKVVNGVNRINATHVLNGTYSLDSRSFVVNWTAPPAGTGTVKFYFAGNATNDDVSTSGDYIYTSTQQVTELLCLPPDPVQPIQGPSTSCTGIQVNYSIPAVPNATSYLWTLPNGWTGASTTTSIAASSNGNSGAIQVSAINACSTTSSSLNVSSVSAVPAIPGTITGSANNNCGVSTKTYSVAAVSGASGYVWRTDIVGATLNGVVGPVTTITPTVSLTFPSNFANAKIYVKAQNACGASAEKSKSISSKPAVPGAISGPVNPCINSINLSYSITAVAQATSYAWTVPSGLSLVSGQGTTNVLVNSGAIAQACSLKVGSTNACGTSSKKLLVVNVTSCIREFEFNYNALHFIDTPERIDIFSTDGRLIQQINQPNNAQSLADLPMGIYIISMQFKDHRVNEKVFVQPN
ncbi:MAG: choice-of-anchor V domain-containing protein [Bacteroidia bacterium]